MNKPMRGTLCLLFTAGIFAQGMLCAQTKAPSFDVATIKPAQSPDVMTLAQQMQNGKLPFRIDDHVFRIDFVRLRDLIAYAYEVPGFQISGQDPLLDGQRWGINATMPEGSTAKQGPQMMQALLAERFGLKIHRENKEHVVYALSVGKSGIKMKESPPDDPAPPPADSKDTRTIDTGQGQVAVKADGKGGATINAGAMGNIKVGLSPEGLIHMEMSKLSMTQMVQQLSQMLGQPVIDKTELKGNYQVAFDFPMSAMLAVARAQGINIPGMPAGAGGAGPADAASDPAAMDAIFKSMDKMGLKLEQRKEPVSDIIVDHVEKTPTEN